MRLEKGEEQSSETREDIEREMVDNKERKKEEEEKVPGYKLQ